MRERRNRVCAPSGAGGRGKRRLLCLGAAALILAAVFLGLALAGEGTETPPSWDVRYRADHAPVALSSAVREEGASASSLSALWEDDQQLDGAFKKLFALLFLLFNGKKILKAILFTIAAGIVVTVLVVLVKKRKTETTSDPRKRDMAQPQGPSAPSPGPWAGTAPSAGGFAGRALDPTVAEGVRVTCVEGTALGQSASGNTVTVGRSPERCQLAFPGSSNGVSREHCLVSAVDGQIMVTDISTYGTFLASGREGDRGTVGRLGQSPASYLKRLPKGQSSVLENGQILRLGSDKVQVQAVLTGQGELMLRCVKGPMEGKTVYGRSISIGRDPDSCQLVYPPGTRGVSRLHCRISAAGGAIQILDSSSFGCYISGRNDGLERLPKQQAVPVADGQVLYLGSRQNAIRVELPAPPGRPGFYR